MFSVNLVKSELKFNYSIKNIKKILLESYQRYDSNKKWLITLINWIESCILNKNPIVSCRGNWFSWVFSNWIDFFDILINE